MKTKTFILSLTVQGTDEQKIENFRRFLDEMVAKLVENQTLANSVKIKNCSLKEQKPKEPK